VVDFERIGCHVPLLTNNGRQILAGLHPGSRWKWYGRLLGRDAAGRPSSAVPVQPLAAWPHPWDFRFTQRQSKPSAKWTFAERWVSVVKHLQA
jgi:hypothetical protein